MFETRLQDSRLAVIGLGYVGLPLAVEFGKRRDVVGFDINPARIEALRAGHDETREVADYLRVSTERIMFSELKHFFPGGQSGLRL